MEFKFNKNYSNFALRNWRKLEKKLAEGKFLLSVPILTNATEEICLFLRLAVCLKPQLLLVSYLYHV